MGLYLVGKSFQRMLFINCTVTHAMSVWGKDILLYVGLPVPAQVNALQLHGLHKTH